MAVNITIRSKIDEYLRTNGKTLQALSESIGLNKGILSAIMNRNPPKAIAVRQLDLITAGMGLPEGALYVLYVDECLITNPPNRLPEDEQLDALRDLGNVYTALHEWERLDEIADQLETIVASIYKYECESNRYDESNRKTKYPLVVYYAYAYVMKAEVCDNRKDYEQAKKYIRRYADLNWFMGLGEEGKKNVIKFSEWSRANAYVLEMKTGKINVLPEYVSYFENREYEILPALEIIMKAANQYYLDVDHILLKFEDNILSYIHLDFEVGDYNQQLSMDRHTSFFYEVAYYYFKKSKYVIACRYISTSLSSSIRMNNKSNMIQCMKLFEEFRELVSVEALHEYKYMIKGVHDDAKNDIFFVGS